MAIMPQRYEIIPTLANKSNGRHEKQPPPVVVLYVMFG